MKLFKDLLLSKMKLKVNSI